jgi:hypothetical protein
MQMLIWILGCTLFFSIVITFLRPKKSSFEEQENERIIQEEGRARANTWFGG